MQKGPITLLTFFIVLLQTVLPNFGYAAAPVVHISPKPVWLNTFKAYDKKVSSRNITNGYFYQVFEEQLHVEKQADYTHIIKEIVSEAGIQNGSSINIGFDPSFERLDVHNITVWRNNKPEKRLSARSFKILADEKELSRFIYQGSYSAYCILNDIRKGDRIEYSYTITGRNPIFNNKFFRDLYFQSSVPFAHVYKSILVSPSRKLNFKSFNKTPQVSVSIKDGLTNYEWNAYQVMPVEYFDNQPGWYNNYAYIQVSDYSSWKEVTDWALSVNPVMPVTNGKLAVQVAGLKAATKGDKEKYFRGAVKMVQDEVRYMGIEMGEYSHRANNPEKVFNQRYGDCKDKSLLLASVLRAGGIEAEMVLVNSGIDAGIDKFIPTPNAFNHAVVVATINNKQVWVDATIAYQRGTGTNIYFPGYGKGLVLKPNNNGLTTIIPAKTGKIDVQERFTVTDEKAKVPLIVTTVYTLNEADKMRDRLASSSMSETEKNYLTYYTKVYPKIEQTDSVTVIEDEENNKVTTIEHYLISDLLKKGKETGRFTAGFYANYINDLLPVIPNKAVSPVALSFPLNVNYTIQVVMHDGWNIEEGHNEIKRYAYVFKSKSSAENDTLSVNYQLVYLKDFIPVNKLDETRDDAKKISDNELSYGFTFTPDVSKVPFHFNYWMFLAVAIFVAGLVIQAMRIYKTETKSLMFVNWRYQMPIGGWLILIALGLAITPLAIFVTIINNGSFDLSKWNLALPGASKAVYKAAFAFEIFGNIFSICYTSFCFFLLIKRRDILPKFVIGLYAYYVVFHFVDYALLQATGVKLDIDDSKDIMRSMVAAAIWIPYFIKSTRVQKTFIMPYPVSNYAFDTNIQPQSEGHEQEIKEDKLPG
jgi:transglutaminase-like putative cysteine protease